MTSIPEANFLSMPILQKTKKVQKNHQILLDYFYMIFYNVFVQGGIKFEYV